jgi:hypothetical protein
MLQHRHNLAVWLINQLFEHRHLGIRPIVKYARQALQELVLGRREEDGFHR